MEYETLYIFFPFYIFSEEMIPIKLLYVQ